VTETYAIEQSLRDAAELLTPARRIAVMAHINPDADAIGTTLGLTLGLQALGKDAIAVLSDPVPRYAQFLPGSDRILSQIPNAPFDVLLCADAADPARLGPLYGDIQERYKSTPVLNLDHHRTNPRYGSVNFVDPLASSSSELAFRLLDALDAPIDPGTATALLFGIIGDTGSFQNGATTPSALETAGRLVRLGADNQKIAFQLFEWKTFAAARLFGQVLTTIDLDRVRRIVFAYMSQQMLHSEGASADEMEGIAEYLRGIEEAEVVMLMKETPEGDIRVSMRSRPSVDVAAIASSLDGGGHRQAAGCTLPGPCEVARATLTGAYDRLNPS
jgi:phosphoesterase RecJ-like protein